MSRLERSIGFGFTLDPYREKYIHGSSVLGSVENLVSIRIQDIDCGKNITKNCMDVSTPAGISEIKSYAINSAAPPETAKSQVTKMIRLSEPPFKKSPGHY